jgi:hypothetical protein
LLRIHSHEAYRSGWLRRKKNKGAEAGFGTRRLPSAEVESGGGVDCELAGRVGRQHNNGEQGRLPIDQAEWGKGGWVGAAVEWVT